MLAAFIIEAIMEAASTSVTSVNFYQTTRHNNPEDSHLLVIYVLFFISREAISKLETLCPCEMLMVDYIMPRSVVCSQISIVRRAV
jgi:hypothetical protein